jgi:EAL domain-containing protein (putative c-di-GMP-specific phosphodiesterase class I)
VKFLYQPKFDIKKNTVVGAEVVVQQPSAFRQRQNFGCSPSLCDVGQGYLLDKPMRFEELNSTISNLRAG